MRWYAFTRKQSCSGNAFYGGRQVTLAGACRPPAIKKATRNEDEIIIHSLRGFLLRYDDECKKEADAFSRPIKVFSFISTSFLVSSFFPTGSVPETGH
jgi:hypothetical protein